MPTSHLVSGKDAGMHRDYVIGSTRACPDCGRPQHYTGTEHGWAHDAILAMLQCGASPALFAELEK